MSTYAIEETDSRIHIDIRKYKRRQRTNIKMKYCSCLMNHL